MLNRHEKSSFCHKILLKVLQYDRKSDTIIVERGGYGNEQVVWKFTEQIGGEVGDAEARGRYGSYRDALLRQRAV